MATASAAMPPREKIRFDYGRAETVVLKHATGKKVQGIYGAQFMFTTADDRIFFVDHEIAYAIEKCPGAAEGQPITITRSKGPRNATNWDIRPGIVPQTGARGMALLPQQSSELETRLEASIAHAQATRAAAVEAPAQQPVTTAQAKLLAALCVAIDSCVEAKAYAQRRGLPLAFTGEDVRCFANTILINGERGR